jgi:hypothetical protein
VNDKNNIDRKKVDTLFKSRFHGAVNIRGIRYQILYSLFRTFDLYDTDKENCLCRLEGIEDIDLLGFEIGNEYVQVKTSDKPWNWAKYKEPLKGFIEQYRINQDSRFILAVNFKLNTDIEKLTNFDLLTSTEKKRVQKKFRNLCNKINISQEESNILIERVRYISLTEETIWNELRHNTSDLYNLSGDSDLLIYPHI